MNQHLMATKIYYFLVLLSFTKWGKTESVEPATELWQPEELEANRKQALTSDEADLEKRTGKNATVQ